MRKLKLHPNLLKKKGANLPPISLYTYDQLQKMNITFDKLAEINKYAYGTFDYIPDPKDSEDKLHTLATVKKIPNSNISKKNWEKLAFSNAWKWVNHASRLQYTHHVDKDRPYRRLLCVPLSSIFGLRIRVTDQILTAFTALSIAASKRSLRMIIYVDFEVPQSDIHHLFAIFKALNEYRTNTIGLYQFVEEGFEYKNVSYLTPIVRTTEQLETCIRMNIRCCPHYSLLTEEGTKVSQILESHVYKAWVRECWRNTWPVLWTEKESSNLVSKLIRLGHTVLI